MHQVSEEQIERSIRAAAECLPQQGPITAFAFLNPLQGMEDIPFDEALRTVSRIYGCEPYLEEGRYRAKLERGRITTDELKDVLEDDLGNSGNDLIAGISSRRDIRMSMLQHPLNSGHERELQWVIAETDALQRFRPEISHDVRERLLQDVRVLIMRDLFSLSISQHGLPFSEAGSHSAQDPRRTQSAAVPSPHAVQLLRDSLQDTVRSMSADDIEERDEEGWERLCLQMMWSVIHRGVESVISGTPTGQDPVRHRDLLQLVRMTDCDQLVHEVLVSYCSAWLDQGYAHWKLPDRDMGFYAAFRRLYSQSGIRGKLWTKGLPQELERIHQLGLSPLQSIQESLSLLGVSEAEHAEYLRAVMLALRGFSGMLWQTEVRPDRVYISSPPGTLIEYVAVRLILDRLVLKYAAAESLHYQGPLSELRDYLRCRIVRKPITGVEQQAFIIFQLAQLLGWSPRILAELTIEQWGQLSGEILAFSNHERRRIFHAAFERHLSGKVLDAVAVRTSRPPCRPDIPRLQVVCCIDAREESFRRHLEEIAPDVETFGTAGFFGIAMYYRGAVDAHFDALCPIVIKPQHWVVEDVVYSLEDQHRSRARARRVLGTASHSLHVGTRSWLGGAFLSTLLGPLATVPMLSRILFPRMTASMNRTARQFVAPPAVTRLRLERELGEQPGPEEHQIGFTLAEMAERAERALRDIGLTSSFAKLVIFLGHGSSCLNNPHESAYHCGACSGSSGGPNARAVAAMLNDQRVRRILRERGLEIPEETHFIGGLHNTATEEITFYDMELLPTAHVGSLRLARDLFGRTAERNAHERCRRFDSASLSLSPAEALLHVQDRTEDLAQTRPEYGNGTNAMCFVGRRSRIRGLYLDRRSFLMSYDATQDDGKSSILARILAAVIPVCEGINMLYTLSAMDSSGWGSGTKLPHNVTSLLGVMDGAASDLRSGLPWQGVDIHEPVRLLFVIESTPESLLRIMDENPVVGRICRNGWAQLAVLDPGSSKLRRFNGADFVPYEPLAADLPEADTSGDWYRGSRDNLEFAQIGISASQKATSC